MRSGRWRANTVVDATSGSISPRRLALGVKEACLWQIQRDLDQAPANECRRNLAQAVLSQVAPADGVTLENPAREPIREAPDFGQ